VVLHGADVGIALDGDADRVMVIDETGQVADGDQIMALFAARWADEGRLRDGTLVASVMSNLGLERFLTGAACGWSARRWATATWSSGCATAAGTLAASSRAIS
jgi:phosphomannomutase